MATLTTLVSFNETSGEDPEGTLFADAAGDLFGTAPQGGANGVGTVFEIPKTSSGYASTPTVLVSFNSTDGAYPATASGLIADAAGDLFGTTAEGGANGDGSVFDLVNNGGGSYNLTTLVSFNGTNGSYAHAGLIADAAGDLFGMTQFGGANNEGTVFEIPKTSSGYGTLTKLASFNSTDGSGSALIFDPAGDLIGTTVYGGANGDGSVFELVNNGGGSYNLTTLASFNGSNGGDINGVIADAAGDLFGTTYGGGANNDGTVFELPKTSSGYGTLTTLVSFNGANGLEPAGGLIVDAAGDLFGTTQTGGTNNGGTVFEIPKTTTGYGTLATLVSFNGTNGGQPTGGLIANAAGDLFGTTEGGTVFELSGTGFQVATTTLTPNAQPVLFQGVDASDYVGLWATNGTAPGTQELTGISGANSSGFTPTDLTAFNGEVLFNAFDASGNQGLWVSNGTAAGTQELTPISGAWPGPIGLAPEDMTVFNGEVLFGGNDASDAVGLWVTNGTAAGTSELTGVSGAYSLGLFYAGSFPNVYSPSNSFSPDFTVFNGAVLFDGKDAGGQYGLWVTNGTAAGTSELTGISGAWSGGVGLDPESLTVFNGEVLFNGFDASDNQGLWVTNGTASGTLELTGISGAYTGSGGLDPGDLTVFNGAVLFDGRDASGSYGLWATNGTAAGTTEIGGIGSTGISGAGPNGLQPSDMTVFNGEVLFAGEDASGHDGLWVTNGTAAGTYELTGISGVYTGVNGLVPTDLTVVNGEVLFAGTDASGNDGLWATNGTAAGTQELTPVSGAYAVPLGLDPSQMAVLIPSGTTPTLTTLVTFDGTDGNRPQGTLIADAAGDLFGVTFLGGANNDGTVFEIAKSGGSFASTPTTLVTFNTTNGENPEAGLINNADAAGDLFGTTTFGGANNEGTVFEIPNTGGSYASTPNTLVSFNISNGEYPTGGLLADAAGDLFGTTLNGGASGDGTVFEIPKTASGYGTPTILVGFNGSNGAGPQAGLLADAAGDLFGTTFNGGASGDGTVFEIAKTGGGSYAITPTILVSFNGTNGASPYETLIADAAGDLFGTTEFGGANGDGTVFEIPKTASGYGTPTILVSFNGSNGQTPLGNLLADAAGDLFGTTLDGGANGDGTVFEIAKSGGSYASTPTTLFSFNGTDGANPFVGLTADAAGDLFGTTNAGGANNDGTVFELTGTGFVPCFCRGTLILTETGEVPVEGLAIGDRVVTLSGGAKPIKWIGRRSYGGRFAFGQTQILPVCVTAGALDDGVPRRDLWISPNHALYLEGVLIEARDLVNGVSIVQAERVEAIHYFHIELDGHDVIVGEGAQAESFIDDDSRGLFHNAHEYRALHPAAAGSVRYCAPRRDQGCEVERARAAIARRAGLAVTAEVPSLGLLRGQIEEVGRRIYGWAQDAAHPDAPVCLDILAGGELIGQVVANRCRADLMAAGLGSFRHGFEFVLPAGVALAPRSIEVRRSLDGASLTLEQRPARCAAPRPRNASAG